MHESRESRPNPGDQGRGKNNDKKASESRSASQTDFERPASANPGDKGGVDTSEFRTGSVHKDVLRSTALESDGARTTLRETPHSSYTGTWHWPNNLEEQSPSEVQHPPSTDKGKGKMTEGPQHDGEPASSKSTIDAILYKNLRSDETGGRTDKEKLNLNSASDALATALVNQWKADKLPHANLINKKMLLKTYPTIGLAIKLTKELATLGGEQAQFSSLIRGLDETKQVRSSLRDSFDELGGKIARTEKDRQKLEETFPKSPEEVATRARDISDGSREKAQAILDKWQEENRTDVDQVDQAMVLRHFSPVIQKATALEKTDIDVTSVKESLQDAKETFPKSPGEVLQKEREWIEFERQVAANRNAFATMSANAFNNFGNRALRDATGM